MNDDVIIVGSLDKKELEKSIQELVDYVGKKTNDMADKFTEGLDKMKLAMKDFAITQKVSVDLMKEAWRNMSSSFDAMVAAQSAATGSSHGGGGGSGKPTYPDNTVGSLEQIIRLEEKRRKEMELGSDELREQNKLIEERKNTLKSETTSKKTLKDVLGMDENSVEAVAKKMRELKRIQIDPNNAQQVKLLGDEYQRLSRRQSELLGKNIQLTHSNNYLAQSFGYIRNRVVYALTLGAITSFTKQIYEIRGQYELLERSLGVLVNSFEKGSQMFQELNAMAIESPFTLMELAGAAKQLSAYNFAANEVVDTTRRLADISSALGVPTERLVYNLGQIRAQTVLTARDARDFANAGLPIVKSLSDYYTELEGKVVSTGDVYDRMSKKMVSYSDVMSVLNKMTDEGGKFFEFQAKQAETLRVQMANLTLAWNNMLNEIGKSNQGLLVAPIKGLKLLLQNWSTLDRLIKSLVVSFGLLKIAQIATIKYTQGVSLAVAASDVVSKKFLATIYRLVGAIKTLAANPWTWVFTAFAAFINFKYHAKQAREEIAELNEEIRKGADEASNSNIDWLNNKGNIATREAAKEGSLSAEQAAKAWESIEQQLNQSASSANALIGELWQIDDVNERVAKGFDYVERIQKSQAALQDLRDDTIKISSDSWLWGAFGEGLVSDLKDLQEELGGIAGGVGLFDNEGKLKDVSGGFIEYREELEKTAESINNFIVAHKITDPLQINEILERVKAIIKTKNPEIKGELATLFDVTLDQRMMFLTNGAIDQNTSLWKMFLDRLRHNSSAAFQDITDEIYTENGKLTQAQQNAVDNNLEYFKNTMPWYYDAIKEMVDDASRLKIQIGIAFNVQQLTEFQKQVQERVRKASGVLDFGNDSMLPTQNDNLQTWVKTQQDAINALREQNKLYAKDSSQWSKDQIEANDKEIGQRKNLLDLFNQSYEKEKKTRGSAGKDYVAEALKQELSIIKEMRSNYDKLRKAGVNDTDALKLSAQGYELTLERINNVLQKFGISKFNASDFAGKNVRQLLDSLTKQRDTLIASGKVKTSSLKDLDVEIQKLTVDAKTYDMKKITDGLNSELGKLKDEYELSLELDANPELGDMFADMFGIDTTDFPRTIDAYMQKVQEKFDKARMGLNLSESLNIFTANTEQWYNWGKAVGYSEEQVDNFKKSFDGAVGVAKKWAQDTIKQTQDLQYELADNNERIAIEEQKLANLRKRLAQETNDKQKELLELQIQRQQNAIAKLKEEVLQLLPTYMNLFNSIAEHSASVTRRLAKQWKDALHNAVLNMDGTYTITDPLSGEKATITAKQYGTQIGKVNDKLRETQTSWQKIKEAFTKKDEDGIVDWQQGLALVGDEISNIANSLQELSSILEDVGVKFSDDLNYAIEGLSQVGSGVSEFARGLASGNWIQAAVGGVKAVVGLGKTAAGIFGGTKKDYFTELNNSLQGLLDTLNKVADYQLESLGKMTGSKAASEYRKMIENNEMAIKSYRDLAEARGRSGSSWGSHSYAYRTNRELKNDWNEISKYAGQTVTSIQDMYNLSPENLKEIMTNMPVQWSKIDEEIRKALESIIEYGDKANEYTEALGVAMTNMSLDDLVNDFERMLQDMDSDAEEFSENFEEYMRNAIIRSMMVGTYASELENWYKHFKQRIEDDELSEDDVRALRDEYMGIVKRAYADRDRLTAVIGEAAKQADLSALQQGIQGITENTAGALESYMNGVSQQVYLHSDLLTQIRDAVVGFDMGVQLGVFSQMLLQLQQSYIVQQNIENLLQNVINPSGRAFMVELAS